jgi:hypothetical protein
MNGVPVDLNREIPGVLGQMHDRCGNTPKDVALVGEVLDWIESRPRVRDAVMGGGV